ncbi:hypothetical protein QVD17_31125 [Tagetes erecta]|uniref:Uncharacterized protein n=1 Tax=Tagetes erecta TaxID=13708 RepID=A0AAD8K2U3_TARER|nr:hypothetical protein QVD17_31125 [Tagetes erecta]
MMMRRCYGGPSNADLVSRLSNVKSDNGEGKASSPTENGGNAVYGGLGGGGNGVILNALQVIKGENYALFLIGGNGDNRIGWICFMVNWIHKIWMLLKLFFSMIYTRFHLAQSAYQISIRRATVAPRIIINDDEDRHLPNNIAMEL